MGRGCQQTFNTKKKTIIDRKNIAKSIMRLKNVADGIFWNLGDFIREYFDRAKLTGEGLLPLCGKIWSHTSRHKL